MRKYDLYSDRFRAETYSTFAEMRERDPVLCQPGLGGESPIWFITRYDDITGNLGRADRSRRGERRAGSRRRLRLPASDHGDRGAPLGIPVADRNRFRLWSNAIVTPALEPAALARFGELMDEFVAYLHELFVRRRAEPGDDLVSALLQAEDGGDTLSEQELLSMVSLLIVAGHETTVSLIGNAVLALLQQPERRAALAADPATVPRAIEELLRYDGPVERALTRWVAENVEVSGKTIGRGDAVIVILGSAAEELSWRPVPLFRSLVALPVAW